MDRLLARPRFLASLLAGFAVAATVLAAVGLFGALAYSVAQRQRESGVRMALGADAARVARSVAGDAARIGGVGLRLGLAAAAGAGRGVARFLFGVQPLDLWSFGVTACALGSIAILAAWLPARRAARVEPMEAVRAKKDRAHAPGPGCRVSCSLLRSSSGAIALEERLVPREQRLNAGRPNFTADDGTLAIPLVPGMENQHPHLLRFRYCEFPSTGYHHGLTSNAFR